MDRKAHFFFAQQVIGREQVNLPYCPPRFSHAEKNPKQMVQNIINTQTRQYRHGQASPTTPHPQASPTSPRNITCCCTLKVQPGSTVKQCLDMHHTGENYRTGSTRTGDIFILFMRKYHRNIVWELVDFCSAKAGPYLNICCAKIP